MRLKTQMACIMDNGGYWKASRRTPCRILRFHRDGTVTIRLEVQVYHKRGQDPAIRRIRIAPQHLESSPNSKKDTAILRRMRGQRGSAPAATAPTGRNYDR